MALLELSIKLRCEKDEGVPPSSFFGGWLVLMGLSLLACNRPSTGMLLFQGSKIFPSVCMAKSSPCGVFSTLFDSGEYNITEDEIKNFFDEVYSQCQDSFAVSDDWDSLNWGRAWLDECPAGCDVLYHALRGIVLRANQFLLPPVSPV